MRYRKIPDETIRRLPIYLRALLHSLEQRKENISSRNLAAFVGVNSWQIRKDFSYFGDFGIPGVGYNTKNLVKQINKILRLDTGHTAALVGVGNLGTAVLAYPGFKVYGFDIVAAFDIDPKKTGRKIHSILIENVSKIGTLKKRNVDLGIIAVPSSVAQQSADALVKAGIKGILNFSPCHLNVPEKVKVITLDIAMDFARLPYYISAG